MLNLSQLQNGENKFLELVKDTPAVSHFSTPYSTPQSHPPATDPSQNLPNQAPNATLLVPTTVLFHTSHLASNHASTT
jgi:hypothetical protein